MSETARSILTPLGGLGRAREEEEEQEEEDGDIRHHSWGQTGVSDASQSPHLGISDLPAPPGQRISCLFSKDSPHLKYLQSGVIES